MIIGLKCPHCDGHVGPLLGGMRQSYCGRQRLCLKCGTIWRMNKTLYGSLIGASAVLAATGVIVLYRWLRPDVADWWSLAWLAVWVVVLWPLLYYAVWRVWVAIKK